MIEMTRTVKMVNLPVRLAARIFASLNQESVVYQRFNPFGGDSGYGVIVSYVDPDELIYPEGWYFAKGHFRNKHNTDGGIYYEIPMYQSGGELW